MNGNENEMTFIQKLENYWYHYKWQTIIGIFIFVFAAICVTQCANNSDADAMIMYAGNYAVANDYKERSLESLMKEDSNGDGEKRVDVFQLVINITEKGGEYEYYDAVGQSEELQRLEIEFSTGSSVIYLLHPYIYKQYKNIMVPLEEMPFEIPAEAVYDEKGIRLSELSSYQNTTLNFYPEECILCIRNQRTEDNLISRKDNPEYYNANMDFLGEIVGYRNEE